MRNIFPGLRWLVVTAIVFCAALYANAQQQTAELTGLVTDSSGAAVANATVDITNPARGIKVKVTTNANGIYVAPLLPPADGYAITVSKTGFQQLTRNDITLQVAQTATVNLTLAIGSSNQTVVVTGAPPLLDAQTSSVGQVIEARTITALPLNGRSTFRLIQLTPGVTFNRAAYGQFGDVPINTTWDTSFSVNGGQAQSNEVLIDGVPSEVGYFNQITTIPSVDATQEFKVESNNLSAEYGRFAGGVVNVTTKSGTNDWHGTVFDFLRNSALDANDFIDKSKGNSIPPLKMNQYGGALGGPVWIPHIYNGRDKTFFFGDYQGTKRVQGTTFVATVPTELERTGDFSQSGVIIYDPATSRPDPSDPTGKKKIRDPFPDNVIPTDRIDPVAKALMSYYPLPNTTGANNFISNAPRKVDQNSGGIRIDQNVNDHYHFFGRFGWLLTDLVQPNTFGNVATGGAGAVGTTKFHNWSFAFDNTITINPTLLLTVNYGYARWYQARQTLSYGFDNSKLGFPDQFVSSVTIPMFPSINVAGYAGMNGQSYLSNGNDSHALMLSLTKIMGRHTLIAGTDLRMHMINFFNVGSAAGVFRFAAAQTQGSDPNKATPGHGDAMASLLLGFGSSGSMPIGAGTELRDWYTAAYLQDNYRATNKLTLNLGLRYETESPYTDRHNKLNYFNPDVPSPAANDAFPNLTGGLLFAGVNGAPANVYDWNVAHFEPRVGFAYNIFPSTVVRGGGGLVYAPLEVSNNAVGFAPTTGFSSTTNWVTTVDGLTPENVLSNPYPQGLVQPEGASLGAATALGQNVTTWDAHPKTPLSYQWNFGIQQQLPSSILVEAAYVASRGMHLTHNFNHNALNPEYLSMGNALQDQVDNPFQPYVSIGALSNPKVQRQQLLLPFPQFTGVDTVNETWGDSSYESAQFKVNKRTTHGISVLAVYTISKWLSDVTVADAPIGPTNNTGVQNWYDLRAEKSLSENDYPQDLIVNVVADLPFGRGQRYLNGLHGPLEKIIEGWKASGILTEQSGQPLTLSAPDTGPGNRPDWNPQVSTPRLSSSRSNIDKVGEWFNIDAFQLPQPWKFGNVPRTTGRVRGPGIQNLDFTLSKQTQIFERLNMEFRAEAFNLTNTPHFVLPDTNMADYNPNPAKNKFGKITGVLASPPAREIQFAVKFKF